MDSRTKAGGLRDMEQEVAEVPQECHKVRLHTHTKAQTTGKVTKKGAENTFY